MPAPFVTGKNVSAAEPAVITVPTAPDSWDASQAGNRNRKWTLTTNLDSADMAENPYRAAVVVNNVAGAGTAWLVFGLNGASYSEGSISVPSGSSVTFSRENHMIGTGTMCVVLEGSSTGTIVLELSYEA